MDDKRFFTIILIRKTSNISLRVNMFTDKCLESRIFTLNELHALK